MVLMPPPCPGLIFKNLQEMWYTGYIYWKNVVITCWPDESVTLEANVVVPNVTLNSSAAVKHAWIAVTGTTELNEPAVQVSSRDYAILYEPMEELYHDLPPSGPLVLWCISEPGPIKLRWYGPLRAHDALPPDTEFRKPLFTSGFIWNNKFTSKPTLGWSFNGGWGWPGPAFYRGGESRGLAWQRDEAAPRAGARPGGEG